MSDFRLCSSSSIRRSHPATSRRSEPPERSKQEWWLTVWPPRNRVLVSFPEFDPKRALRCAGLHLAGQPVGGGVLHAEPASLHPEARAGFGKASHWRAGCQSGSGISEREGAWKVHLRVKNEFLPSTIELLRPIPRTSSRWAIDKPVVRKIVEECHTSAELDKVAKVGPHIHRRMKNCNHRVVAGPSSSPTTSSARLTISAML